MYIANECYNAKVVSLDYNGTNPAVHTLTNNYPGSITAINDNIFATTTDGTTNSTAFLEVKGLEPDAVCLSICLFVKRADAQHRVFVTVGLFAC
jgi:hypothetical protein